MKLVAYLRVSTDRQAEEGLGLDVQERTIRQWAKQHGHRLVTVTKDAGVSGSNGLDSRLGLAEALDHLRDQRAQGLVVYRLDRLARDLIVQEQLLADLRRLGADVFSTSDSEAAYLTDDPNDPSRTLIRQVLGAVSQYERSMIKLRLRAGRLRKAQTGGYAYGAPPFGYRAFAGELVVDEREHDAVEKIRTWRASGSSLRQIATRLDAEGLTTKRGRPWHPATVARILSRP